MASLVAHGSGDTLWGIAVGMGFVVVLAVIVLLTMLLRLVQDIDAGANAIAEAAGGVAGNTVALEQLATTGAVVKQIREEAVTHLGRLSEL